jgi:uncharacterized protein YdaU (DUF1376 family)
MRRNWMPLYIPDFLADTGRLSAAETGAYLCLIMDYWMHDGLPDDDAKLAQIARLPLKSWRQMRPTIEAYFREGWRHKRIDAEIGKMINSSHRRQAAGSKGGTVSSIRRSNASSNATSIASSIASSKSSSKGSSKDPFKKAAFVQHTTQERNITTTCSVAARASENTENRPETEPDQAKSGSAMGVTGSPPPNEDLASVLKKKGWVP